MAGCVARVVRLNQPAEIKPKAMAGREDVVGVETGHRTQPAARGGPATIHHQRRPRNTNAHVAERSSGGAGVSRAFIGMPRQQTASTGCQVLCQNSPVLRRRTSGYLLGDVRAEQVGRRYVSLVAALNGYQHRALGRPPPGSGRSPDHLPVQTVNLPTASTNGAKVTGRLDGRAAVILLKRTRAEGGVQACEWAGTAGNSSRSSGCASDRSRGAIATSYCAGPDARPSVPMSLGSVV